MDFLHVIIYFSLSFLPFSFAHQACYFTGAVNFLKHIIPIPIHHIETLACTSSIDKKYL